MQGPGASPLNSEVTIKQFLIADYHQAHRAQRFRYSKFFPRPQNALVFRFLFALSPYTGVTTHCQTIIILINPLTNTGVKLNIQTEKIFREGVHQHNNKESNPTFY